MRAVDAHAIATPVRTRRGSFAWLGEVGFIAAFYLSYEVLRAARHPSAALALSRARSIEHAEALVHLDIERAVNTFTTAHHALSLIGGYYYATLHFCVTPAVLAWLWWRRPQVYARYRSVLAVATVTGLLIYWLLPVAPPRLALHGTTDTLVASNIFGAANAHGVNGLVNVYAAMPSLHVGWASWVALVVFQTNSGRWRWAAWAYPAATTLVVVATANHYLADAAAGIGLVVAARFAIRGDTVTALRRRRRLLSVAAGDATQLSRVRDQVDRRDPAADDGEADDADRAPLRREHRTGLSVNDRVSGIGDEPRRGRQHTHRDRLGAHNGKRGAGRQRTSVGAEHDVRVQNLEQSAKVARPGRREERVDDRPLTA
jgi:hypothetical protein